MTSRKAPPRACVPGWRSTAAKSATVESATAKSATARSATACMAAPFVHSLRRLFLLCGFPRSHSSPLWCDQAFAFEQREDAAAAHQADERGRHGPRPQRLARRQIADREIVERDPRALPLLEQARNPGAFE